MWTPLAENTRNTPAADAIGTLVTAKVALQAAALRCVSQASCRCRAAHRCCAHSMRSYVRCSPPTRPPSRAFRVRVQPVRAECLISCDTRLQIPHSVSHSGEEITFFQTPTFEKLTTPKFLQPRWPKKNFCFTINGNRDDCISPPPPSVFLASFIVRNLCAKGLSFGWPKYLLNSKSMKLDVFLKRSVVQSE